MISVIIPTYNRNDLLSKCLNLLHPSIQDFEIGSLEIIVSDDSKKGIAKELILQEYTWVKWLDGPKKGPAANRNHGANFAKGGWLLFIDDDCEPHPNLINIYKEAIINFTNTKVFEGKIIADRPKQNFIEESPINETGGKLWSCNFMISKNLFNKLNGFDEAFPYPAMEDVDLHCRIKKLNEEIKFLPEAFVIHPWRTEQDIINRNKKRFKSTLYFLNKHPDMANKISAGYFLRSSFINLKNSFTYGFKFKFKGFNKQIMIALFHLYIAAYLFLHNLLNKGY